MTFLGNFKQIEQKQDYQIYTSVVVFSFCKDSSIVYGNILPGHRALTETHKGFGSLSSLVIIQRIFPL